MPIQEASPIVGSGCKLQQLLDVQPAKIKATVYALEFNPDIAVRAFDLPEMTLFRPASGTTQCHYPDSAANDQEVADDLAGKGFTGDERPEGLTPMVAAAWHESTTHDTTYRTPR